MNPADTPSLLNEAVIDEAESVQGRILSDLLDRLGTKAAVVGSAPAGAGKSTFVSKAIGRLRGEGQRVALVAPTNEQAHSLLASVQAHNPHLPVALVHAADKELPAKLAARLPDVEQLTAKEAQTRHHPMVVATIDKIANAFDNGDLDAFDVLVMDEAYQANAAKYFTAAEVAPTHLLIGDEGQLDPFSTIEDATFWRGGPEDPLQTAVGVLRRNHPSTPDHLLPITWRLDPRAVPVAGCFYPRHHFDSGVAEGTRQLRIGQPRAGGQSPGAVDRALDEAAAHGWAHVTLPGRPLLRADPPTATLLRDLVKRLLERGARMTCERHREWVPLEPRDIAIGVSHRDQRNLVRILLDEWGLQDVSVGTANGLQGLTFQVVLAWHPLAGLPVADAFHLDPGRLCVLLTRHRHACIVVGRETDRALLEAIPPATPGYLGWDPDPVLDGWGAHEGVFEQLESHVVEA
jgi:hypothetical protein